MRNKFFPILLLILSFGLPVAAQQDSAKSLPKVINGGVINGKAVSLPKPEYPAAANAVRASGAVNVRVTIDEQGTVISASAVSGHPLLRQAAEQAARNSTFAPTTLSGQPVKVSGVIVYNFVAADKPAEEDAPIWAFGMMLSFVQNADQSLVKEIGDEKELDIILAEMAEDIPNELAAEKPLFDKLAKTHGEERRAAAGDLLISIKKYFDEQEKWQIAVGEHLGAAMIDVIKHKKNIAGGSAAVDEAGLKTNLRKIKDSLVAAPPETSPELIRKFKRVADFADAPDLKSPAALDELLEAIEPLFGSFADE